MAVSHQGEEVADGAGELVLCVRAVGDREVRGSGGTHGDTDNLEDVDAKGFEIAGVDVRDADVADLLEGERDEL